MRISRSRHWLVVALFFSALIAGCGNPSPATVTDTQPAQPKRGDVVATVTQTDPTDALRLYLHSWMLRYNEQALGEPRGSSNATWAPETPGDFVSVIPAVPMTDFNTVTAWSASIHAAAPVAKTRAAYRADFMFWRGNPLSSAGTGAVLLSSSANYELGWNESERAWVITLTSQPPDQYLAESSDGSTSDPSPK